MSVDAVLTYSGDRKIEIANTPALVNEDAYSSALTTGIRQALENRGIEVDEAAERHLAVQVVLVSVQANPSMTCVIDYNAQLGESLHGMQSRAQNWNFLTACNKALTQSVVDFVNDRHVIDYLEKTQ